MRTIATLFTLESEIGTTVNAFSDCRCPTHIRHMLSQYGDQSNSAILDQPHVRFWGNARGLVGYSITTTWVGKVPLVFANPLCSTEYLDTLLVEFIREFPRAIFVSVNENVRQSLIKRGYMFNHFGWENRLIIDEFSLSGQPKKQLRKAYNKWSGQGAVVRELRWNEVDAQETLALSDAWKNTRKVSKRELNVFTRPPEFNDEPGVRKFFCYLDGKMIGFVFFTPIFSKGAIIGYGSNITRSLRSSEYSGVIDYILLSAINVFRSEGIEVFSLGISPLYDLEKVEGDNRWIRLILMWCYSGLDRLYSFSGLANHKKKYRAQSEKWYLGSPKGASLLLIAFILVSTSGILAVGKKSTRDV